MKILLCTRDMNSGGAGQHIQSLLKEFDDNKDIEKVLVASPSILSGFSNKIQFRRINLFGKTFVTKEPCFAFQMRFVLKKILRNEDFDVIHSHFPLFLPKRHPPVIFTFHGLHQGFLSINGNYSIKFRISKIFHALFKWFDYSAVRNSSKCIFVSEKTLNLAKKKYPKYSKKMLYLPNFINTKKFPKLSDTQRKRSRRKYGLEKNKKYVLYIGRNDVLKGIDDLISAVRELKDIVLFIVGFSSNDIDNIKYLGKIPNDRLYELYNIVDLFVLPSYYENCPTTLLEAISCGCPCLASDVGDAKSILKESRFIFEPGSVQELKIKISDLLRGEVKPLPFPSKYEVTEVSRRIVELYKNEI